LFEESLALERQLDDTYGIALRLVNLLGVVTTQGDYGRAWALGEESLALWRELGDSYFIAASFNNLGDVARLQGDYERATALYEESLALCRKLRDDNDRRNVITSVLEGIGRLAGARGQPARGARLFGFADGLRRATGRRILPRDRAEHEEALAALRTSLGEEAYAAAWAEGPALSLDEAVALALEVDHAP
jgi:non-specific serine/threonine protein kinase